ncbi:RNA-binding protein, partial [Vibrio cholerae]|nr:RNA-binding protein [Vibrio cholerae]MDN6976095.1 RNA-binding protein [Vibrio cholerae]MDN6976214.1 RNA-binding protein [Vibrio cholerae]MDN6987143.1 RNA-binding protein [Vibrio cholerae]MDN6987331.1 RNA-binding protein [Vibrio cholerae]
AIAALNMANVAKSKIRVKAAQ